MSKEYVKLIDGDEFITMWQQYYHKMTDEDKNMSYMENRGRFHIVTFLRLNVPHGGTQDGTQDGTQGGTQGDTQGDTQDVNLDIWIESQLILRPKITTEELALLSGKSIVTIKRHDSGVHKKNNCSEKTVFCYLINY